MGDLSKNFDRASFGCKCDYPECEDIAVDSELLGVLQEARDYFNSPLTINCSYRCRAHNTDVLIEEAGKTREEAEKSKSQHLLGKAADIKVRGVHAHKVYAYFDEKYQGKYGVGKYNSFCHIDVRSWCARW